MQIEKSAQPLISIVTPIYNAERFLEKTLQSVLAQTYPHWEHWLVVDANSSDASLEIARRFASQDPRFRVLQSPEYRGVVKNRNAALDAAQGEYIAFLDADDLWMPEKLQRQLRFMQAMGCEISCHEYTPVNAEDQASGPIRRVPARISFADLLKDNSMGCLTVMLRKDFLASKHFPEIKHEDLALWLGLLKDGTSAHGLQENLALYRVLPSSVSGNKLKSALWRWGIYRSLGFSFGSSVLLLGQYAFSAVWKRIPR